MDIVHNTFKLEESIDLDFVGDPVAGEDSIVTTFTVVFKEAQAIQNSMDDNLQIRYNKL